MNAFLRDTAGATAIEYAMIAGMISILIVGGGYQIGQTVNDFFLKVIVPNL